MPESKDHAAEARPRQAGGAPAANSDPERVVDAGPPPLADAAEASAHVPAAEPPDEEPELARARAEAERGDLRAALNAMRTYIDRHPHDVRGRLGMAALLERRGDLDGALGELGRAIDLAPDDVSLLCARASALTNLKKFDKAEADLRRAARIDETSADVQLRLGVLFCKRARWREAVAPLQMAVDLAPENALAHYYLAEAYNQTDQLEKALDAYEAVAHLEPDNWRALKGVGIVLDRLGRPAEATAAYQRALEVQRR